MKIHQGLFDNMVVQRTSRNRSDSALAGESQASGAVTMRVLRGKKPVRGLERVAIGRARLGQFKGRVAGIPAGGPYAVEVRIENAQGAVLESVTVKNVLVGDVWIMAGQSNMQGTGIPRTPARPHPKVRSFYMDDRWDTAREPIHNLHEAADAVHMDLMGGVRPPKPVILRVGPGLTFGREMLRRTGVPQGLIACAHGGTTLGQWDPDKSALGSKSLYGAMLRRFRKNGEAVAGVLWYQGCSDTSPDAAKSYGERFRKWIAAVRRDFRNPRLPVAVVQIGRYIPTPDERLGWNVVQEQQRQLPETVRHCAVVPVVDLDMEDWIHISGPAQERLGRRLAQAMSVLRGERQAGLPPIALRSIVARNNQMGMGAKTDSRVPQGGTRCVAALKCGSSPQSGGETLLQGAQVDVAFDNVMGGLRAAGLPSGFCLYGGKPLDTFYRADIQGDTVSLKTQLPVSDVRALSLCHGHGPYPHCNITDAADRSLPVFGPIPVDKPRPLTPFVRRLLVSRAMPSAGALKTLAYPEHREDLQLTPREFTDNFCNLHGDLFACAPTDVVACFLCPIECAEPMKLKVCLGYDGPIKMWIDGQQRFHNPKGCNPACEDASLIPFQAAAGRHEVLIALGSNHGSAWGLFLRFLRLDVAEEAFKRGPDAYAMPKVADLKSALPT
ncbi:MAG: sialate O-acetylesterase [Lentisphaerae bacterium]|nr:sialate O-acetylesterase [Lentisphaerota bacterium]